MQCQFIFEFLTVNTSTKYARIYSLSILMPSSRM